MSIIMAGVNNAFSDQLTMNRRSLPIPPDCSLFGEQAAKAGRSIIWDEIIANAKPVKPDLKGLRS